jgi:hypothetical protein
MTKTPEMTLRYYDSGPSRFEFEGCNVIEFRAVGNGEETIIPWGDLRAWRNDISSRTLGILAWRATPPIPPRGSNLIEGIFIVDSHAGAVIAVRVLITALHHMLRKHGITLKLVEGGKH